MSMRAVLFAALATGLILGIAGTQFHDSGSVRRTGSVAEAGR
ncbi:hypothetical protein ACQPZG_29880 [Streptomyces sp. CA-294286]